MYTFQSESTLYSWLNVKELLARQCLVSMIKKWKESVDNGGVLGVFITHIYKNFDCLHQRLLIAKLEASLCEKQ